MLIEKWMRTEKEEEEKEEREEREKRERERERERERFNSIKTERVAYGEDGQKRSHSPRHPQRA